MRRLRTVLLGLVPALLALLGLVALLAPPASSARGLASSVLAPAAAVVTTVVHADVVSVALAAILVAAILVAVVFLTFAANADRRLEGQHRIVRARYLLSHAVPRRYVTTYGVEFAGESFAELATWRQWGKRISDHRTFRLATAPV